MAFNLKGRSFVKELDFTTEEWMFLVNLARNLKAAKYGGYEQHTMAGKNIALIFEKTSTRTRCAFEVAAAQQGAFTTFLDSSASQFGHKESVADSARVLGRMYDAILWRGSDHQTVADLAKHAGVPVYNGLCDDWHPTQMLADQVTMLEHANGKQLNQIAYAYVGDANNNMCHSYLISGAMVGADVRIGAPKAYWPKAEVIEKAKEIAAKTGGSILVTEDPVEAVTGVDFIMTDVWLSMGMDKAELPARIAAMLPYQVNSALMAATGNPNVKFLHCLPAFHDSKTKMGAEIAATYDLYDGVEVTDEVFESPASVVFDQAENRMHTIKAVMVATIGNI